jgi:hypothetical protein
MDIVSQFADRERTENVLSNNEMLRRFAKEFCHEFDTRVMEQKDFSDSYPNNKLRLLTASGMEAGFISIARHRGEDENHYNVTMPTIRKEKASKRSDKGARDSDKLSILLRAIRKNKEEPTDQKLLAQYQPQIRYALNRITRENEPEIRIGSAVTLATVKLALGIDNGEAQFHTSKLQEAYRKYMQQKEKFDNAANDRKRFDKGFYAVGVMHSNRYNAHYLVTEGEGGVDKDGSPCTVIQPTVTRYTSMADSPLAVTAMMIRTYGEGKNWDGDDKDIKLPWADQYYPDIDIATGYSGRDQGVWLLIPKHGE